MKHSILAALVTSVCLAAGTATLGARADNARDMYTRAMAQERTVRDEAAKPTLAQMRRVVAAYENIVRRYPSSGYCDNALWQAANLATLAFDRFGEDTDRKTAARLLTLLAKEYPASKLVAQAHSALEDLQKPATNSAPAPAAQAAPPAAAAPQPVPPVPQKATPAQATTP